jgi:hypothetical protein
MEKEKITDYIGGIEELPELIKKYIRVGIPRKIEITGTHGELTCGYLTCHNQPGFAPPDSTEKQGILREVFRDFPHFNLLFIPKIL